MLFLGFRNDQFIHDFTSGGVNGSQYQISGRSHNGAFGIRHS
jgi:hypothetical protein